MVEKGFRYLFSSGSVAGSLGRRASIAFVFPVLVSVVSIGCFGSAPKGPVRMPISGTVDREGIPVDEGVISFTPLSGGPAANSVIKDGKYKFTAADGVPVGKYKVLIAATRKKDPNFVGRKSDAPEIKDDRFKKPIPKNGWSREAEVTDDKKATYDFEVP